MNRLAAIVLIGILGACAEVSEFKKSNGTSYYYINCDNTMQLFESCGHAARRMCPNGYERINIAADDVTNSDRKYNNCTEENRERKAQGQPETPCARTVRNEGFFACK